MLSNRRESDYEKWQVASDQTVKPSDESKHFPEEGYAFYSIEVKSRILHLESITKKPGCNHPLTYSEELKAVLNKLGERFGGLGGEYYLYVNYTCGFHVHIGNEKKSFPLPTVKKVFSIFLACERQIDKLHARHRINGFETSLPFAFPENLLHEVDNLKSSESIFHFRRTL